MDLCSHVGGVSLFTGPLIPSLPFFEMATNNYKYA